MATNCSGSTIGNGDHEDLISYLPNNVIDCIMDHLSLHDPARLAVMSRKWKDMWKSLPHLKFDAQFFKKVLSNNGSRDIDFFCIVSRILLSHHGPISRFFLHIPYVISETPDISPFITYLSNSGVREITIENCGSSSYILPSHIFSCVELKSLKLDFCHIHVPPTFKNFKNLILLHLENVSFIGNTFGSFIAGCPLLETLILKGLSGVDHPSIDAPNLKVLYVLGTFKSISLKGCHSLLSITIGLPEKVAIYCGYKACDLIDFISSSCKIQVLNIKGYFFECMAATCYWVMSHWTFKELKILQLSNVDVNNMFQFYCVSGLIQSCPIMEELMISFRSTANFFNYGVISDPCYEFCHLYRVTFDFVNGSIMELNLIEFLLSRSPVLGKFYVKRNPEIEPDLERKLARTLMRFPRASTKAEIVYMDPDS